VAYQVRAYTIAQKFASRQNPSFTVVVQPFLEQTTINLRKYADPSLPLLLLPSPSLHLTSPHLTSPPLPLPLLIFFYYYSELSAADCFHPSALSHSVASVALWNNMITPAAQKKHAWDFSKSSPLLSPHLLSFLSFPLLSFPPPSSLSSPFYLFLFFQTMLLFALQLTPSCTLIKCMGIVTFYLCFYMVLLNLFRIFK
jgi:hypothetical protein